MQPPLQKWSEGRMVLESGLEKFIYWSFFICFLNFVIKKHVECLRDSLRKMLAMNFYKEKFRISSFYSLFHTSFFNHSKCFFTTLNSPIYDLQLYDYITPRFFLYCRLLEFTEDALKSLTRAADILKVTHGVKSQFMKELFGKLEEARAEVSFRLSSRHGHDE